jgi:hypothetical protein
MATSCSSTSTLTHLQQLFPGVLLLNSRQTAAVLNMPFKTLSNAGEDFPVPAVRFGPRKFYRLIDIAGHIDGLLGIAASPVLAGTPSQVPPAPAPVENPKRGRGRPRNSGVAR